MSDTPCINTYNIHALRDRFAKIRIEFHVQPKHNSALSSVHFELSHGITFTSAMHIVWYLLLIISAPLLHVPSCYFRGATTANDDSQRKQAKLPGKINHKNMRIK